jgi:Icc-related predicted phosphoesterase
MRFVCLADLHGYLPVVPSCDILLVAGDICPTDDERPESQRRWLHSTFAEWLAGVPAEAVVGVAGNHDFVGEDDAAALRDLDWHYLQDEGIEIGGVSIYGSPWTSRFQHWAFMLSEEELAERWSLIPSAVDVLCMHSPPRGYGDWISGQSIGSPSLLAAIDDRKPELCTFGHVHQGYGRWQRGATTLVNAAYCGVDYRPAHAPVIVELDNEPN